MAKVIPAVAISLSFRSIVFYRAEIKTQGSIVDTPRPQDILCGRGKTRFLHEGNEKLRMRIASWISQYREAESKKEKMKITEMLARSVMKNGGRFLVKHAESGQWVDGGFDIGRKKCAAAVQDAIRKGTRCYVENNTANAASGTELQLPLVNVKQQGSMAALSGIHLAQLASMTHFLQHHRSRHIEHTAQLQRLLLRGESAATPPVRSRPDG